MFHCLFWRTKIKHNSLKADKLKKRKKKHLTRHLRYMNFHCSSNKGFNMSQSGNKEILPDLQACFEVQAPQHTKRWMNQRRPRSSLSRT